MYLWCRECGDLGDVGMWVGRFRICRSPGDVANVRSKGCVSLGVYGLWGLRV